MNRALLAGGVMAAACLTALSASAQTPAQTPPAKPPIPATPADNARVSGVVVNGAKQELETSIDRRSYSVANDLQGKTGNISDVLRNVPAVQVDVSGNVTLRGDGNVTVLVDGKPSVLFNRDTLATALQSMPADQVERIEVITNPSAEFRADGTAGIINLVMKKARGGGKTGSLRANVVSTGGANVSLSHGYNSDKLSIVDSLNLRHERRGFEASYENVRPDPAGGFITSTDPTTARAEFDGAQGRVGVDYDITPKTRLTATVSGNWQKGEQTFDDTFTTINGAGVTTAAFSRRSLQDLANQSVQLDLGLRRKIEGEDLTVRASFGDQTGSNDRLDLTTPGTPPVRLTTREFESTRGSLTADWQKTLKSGVQLKAGYLLEYIEGLQQIAGSTGASAAALTPDAGQTNDFALDETHHQAYVTLQKKFGKVTALGGLRGEAVDLDLDQITTGVQSGQDYTRFYPTLHLSYSLGEGRNLTASYSKRVSRPGPNDLNPFRSSNSATSFIEGNPNLQPQETNSYEVGYEQRKGPASLLATGYYRQTDNAFSVLITDLGGGAFLQQRQNLGHQTNAGVELVLGNRITPKLTYNLSVNGYWQEISSPGLAGIPASSSAFSTFGRANLNWQLTPKDFVQINVFANGKQLLPQGYGAPTVSGNIGYRRTVNDKVSWMLTIQDPFNTLKNELVLDTPTIKDRRIQRQDGQVVSLSLVWNFAGKPRPDTNFDFVPGGGPASAVP